MKHYSSFEEAVKEIEAATTVEEITVIVDDISTLFESDALEVSPRQWAMLCSITLVRTDEIN